MRPDSLACAEQDLTEAVLLGDEVAIAAAGLRVDRFDRAKAPPNLHASALWYVEAVGIPVFPLTPGTKIPFKGSRGCKDATTDVETIRDWWTRTPEANIGLATGHVFDVVDVDGFVGQKSRAQHWEEVFAKIDADSVGKVLTPSPGGMHIYVPATGEGNSTNIVPSVDYRGVGGYVVAPPSRLPNGLYRWLGAPRFGRDEVA